jgi:hypothetical protein
MTHAGCRTAAAVLGTWLVSSLGAPSARADDRVSGPLFAAGTGVSGHPRDDRNEWMVGGELGWGWGDHDFMGAEVWHVSLAAALDILQPSTETCVALLGGYAFRMFSRHGTPLLTPGLAAGVEASLVDDHGIGPVVRSRIGFWYLSLLMHVGTHYTRAGGWQADAVLGLEYVHVPSRPTR